MEKSDASQGQSASEFISKRIAELGDWRGETLGRMRKLIKEADPDAVEELKWVKPSTPGTPVWSHDGIICTGESYKNVVKLTFAKGASLDGSGPSLQLESRGKRTPRDRHPRRRRSRRVRLQGARSPSGRPQQFCQVETFEEREVLRDSAPEQVRHLCTETPDGLLWRVGRPSKTARPHAHTAG